MRRSRPLRAHRHHVGAKADAAGIGGARQRAREQRRNVSPHPFGERAGDILLIAHNGDRDAADGRFYFATLYHSWHGSPSHLDSDIPLIVAHPDKPTSELARLTHQAIGDRPKQQKFTDLVLSLRGLSTRRRAP